MGLQHHARVTSYARTTSRWTNGLRALLKQDLPLEETVRRLAHATLNTPDATSARLVDPPALLASFRARTLRFAHRLPETGLADVVTPSPPASPAP